MKFKKVKKQIIKEITTKILSNKNISRNLNNHSFNELEIK